MHVCMQILPEVILACAKDPAFKLQLCQLLVDCAEVQPDGIAAFHALLHLLKESSSAARCLAGGLRSMLSRGKAPVLLGNVQPQNIAQVRPSPAALGPWSLPVLLQWSRSCNGVFR